MMQIYDTWAGSTSAQATPTVRARRRAFVTVIFITIVFVVV